MLDREGLQRSRIAIGDIDVIRSVAGSLDQDPSPDLRAAIFAGLDVALASGEGWKQARVLRIRGEMHEQAGELDAAINAYDQALTLDPQVGVARKLAKLQQPKSRKGSKASTTKSSRFEKQAQRFGIEHEVVHLDGAGKDWRFHRSDAYKPVELATLDHYQAEGWHGCAAEGGLILTLIKAASFKALPVRHADTFIEALYAKNVAFPEDHPGFSVLKIPIADFADGDGRPGLRPLLGRVGTADDRRQLQDRLLARLLHGEHAIPSDHDPSAAPFLVLVLDDEGFET
jgi:tetratricopeptide (TPR) repeat protein